MTRYEKLILMRNAERIIPALRRVRMGPLKKAVAVLLSPVAFAQMWRAGERPIMPYLELVVTEKCSLRCKDCANLMQHYCAPMHYPLEQLQADIELLAQRASAVWTLQVLGGEPLMLPQLDKLLQMLCTQRFIKRIQVVTNGTIAPWGNQLAALKHRKITVLISNYGEHSRKMETLRALLPKERIRFKTLDYSAWMDYGDLSPRHLTREQRARSFAQCASAECKTLLKGRVYACPRSAHMANLQMTDAAADCLDLADAANFRERALAFYNLESVAACEHCTPPDARASISPGLQMPKKVGEREGQP